MAAGEFELIARYFTRTDPGRTDIVIGVGDDGAVWRPTPHTDVVVATDTLVAGVHFATDVAPAALGHKALAVNLSDLAAMGATPAAALLALTLPVADEAWVSAFATGFFALADAERVALIGGDTTRGPLTITVTVLGCVPRGTALTRAGARPEDAIGVTGTLGDAALALATDATRRGIHDEYLRGRLERPMPRVAAGIALVGCAHAAIDVSDGLLADLGHVLHASALGAELDLDALPLSPALRALAAPQRAATLALTGGDDYELVFTAPAPVWPELLARLRALDVVATRIGTVSQVPGLRAVSRTGLQLPDGRSGYRHF